MFSGSAVSMVTLRKMPYDSQGRIAKVVPTRSNNELDSGVPLEQFHVRCPAHVARWAKKL